MSNNSPTFGSLPYVQRNKIRKYTDLMENYNTNNPTFSMCSELRRIHDNTKNDRDLTDSTYIVQNIIESKLKTVIDSLIGLCKDNFDMRPIICELLASYNYLLPANSNYLYKKILGFDFFKESLSFLGIE
jgi:hypothetical protein